MEGLGGGATPQPKQLNEQEAEALLQQMLALAEPLGAGVVVIVHAPADSRLRFGFKKVGAAGAIQLLNNTRNCIAENL